MNTPSRNAPALSKRTPESPDANEPNPITTDRPGTSTSSLDEARNERVVVQEDRGVRAYPPQTFLLDVVAGLTSSTKSVPSKYLYDERGSELFNQICELEEYYPTNCELAILEQYGADIASEILGTAMGCTLIEYGSGSSHKTRFLLDQLPREHIIYVAVDISEEHLLDSIRALGERYPGLAIVPVAADFTRSFSLPSEVSDIDRPQAHPRRVVYISGSTIGNFVPGMARNLLSTIARLVGRGGGVLLGFDLKKDVEVLERAYNDAEGVTAAFNLNLLERINRELDGNFDLDAFEHRAFFNAEHDRVELHLESQRGQTVQVDGKRFAFREGETICTEYSYKYDLQSLRNLIAPLGLKIERLWTDDDQLFGVVMLSAGGQEVN